MTCFESETFYLFFFQIKNRIFFVLIVSYDDDPKCVTRKERNKKEEKNLENDDLTIWWSRVDKYWSGSSSLNEKGFHSFVQTNFIKMNSNLTFYFRIKIWNKITVVVFSNVIQDIFVFKNIKFNFLLQQFIF